MAVTVSDFFDLLSCNYNVDYSVYDNDGTPIRKEQETSTLDEMIFRKCSFLSELQELGTVNGPISIATILGISWIAVITGDTAECQRFHVLGPIAEQSLTRDAITAELEPYRQNIPTNQLPVVIRNLLNIPIVPPLMAHQYAIMFYYTLTGIKCAHSDICNLNARKQPSIQTTASLSNAVENVHANAMQCWHFENEYMQAVRNGNLNYLTKMYEEYTHLFPSVSYQKDPLRSAKDIGIIFLAFNTHASIEGGISADTAYQLLNNYLHMIEQSQTVSELSVINTTCFEDFLTRVHRHKFTHNTYSQDILHCQEYIQLHIEENLNITRIAEHFHYTIYYFSRKFKAECGYSITDYIKQQKVERAKLLLKTTELTISQISSRLNFQSIATFCTVFRKHTGMSPTTYRKK